MNTKTTVKKVGIVGCGQIALFHLPAIRKSVPQASLTFCDVNRGTAESLARKAGGGTVYTDIGKMLTVEKPDSVHILTSIQTHYTLAKKSLEAGAHVIAEKPAVETMNELNELFGIADERGVIFSADHTLLGMPVVKAARAEVESESLGRLISVHCDFGASRGMRLPYDAGHWAYDARGGAVMNNISHPASLLAAFMDPVKTVKVQGVIRNIVPTQWPDIVHVVLGTDDQIGSFCLSAGHGNGDRSARLLFEKGYIALDFVRQLITVVRGTWPHNFVKKASSGLIEGMSMFFATLNNGFKVVTKKMESNPGLFAVVRSYYGAIERGEPLLVSRQNLVDVTRIVQEVWDQAERDGFGKG